jgi:hypothetical protein
MFKKHEFKIHTAAKIVAWYYRRRGYQTKISLWTDQFLTGMLVNWSFDLTVWK